MTPSKMIFGSDLGRSHGLWFWSGLYKVTKSVFVLEAAFVTFYRGSSKYCRIESVLHKRGARSCFCAFSSQRLHIDDKITRYDFIRDHTGLRARGRSGGLSFID